MELDINVVVLALSVLATIVTAIASFRSSEKSSKFEGVRTQLEVQRFRRETDYDQVVQGSQTVNMMATGLLESTQQRLREVEQQRQILDDAHDHLTTRNVELAITMRQMSRLSLGLNRILEMENVPNGCRDRIERLIELSRDVEERGLTQ